MKILYLTSIPYAWIKQRPQFLAEYLSKDNDVTYCYKRPIIIKKKDLKINESDLRFNNLMFSSFMIFPFGALPVVKHFKLEWINHLFLLFQLPSTKDFDVIWITSAVIYSLLPKSIKNQNNIIYDCMDDILEFPSVQNSETKRASLMEKENRLLRQAKTVICSAEYLKSKIVKRSGIKEEKVIVVNNAVELPKMKPHIVLPMSITNATDVIKRSKHSMVYIGTIDKWFDFDAVLYALNNVEGLELFLFGPLRGNLPNSPKVHYLGTIQRDYIFDIMGVADFLVMPFILNELIRSVNPVKIYEYIYAAKYVIATKYGETMKFKDYVYLYSSKEEFLSIIINILNDTPIIDVEKNRKYVQHNTWKNRYDSIKLVLEEEFEQ